MLVRDRRANDVRREHAAGRRNLLRRAVARAAGLAVTGVAARRAAATEREVVFTSGDGVPLAGSLMLPPPAGSDGSVAALLLIQGSGPTDRNGNQPPTLISDLLRQIAEALAAAGIASLRYDKRGMFANRSSLPSGQAALASFFSWPAIVGDAREA